jgi:hypothetical protein
MLFVRPNDFGVLLKVKGAIRTAQGIMFMLDSDKARERVLAVAELVKTPTCAVIKGTVKHTAVTQQGESMNQQRQAPRQHYSNARKTVEAHVMKEVYASADGTYTFRTAELAETLGMNQPTVSKVASRWLHEPGSKLFWLASGKYKYDSSKETPITRTQQPASVSTAAVRKPSAVLNPAYEAILPQQQSEEPLLPVKSVLEVIGHGASGAIFARDEYGVMYELRKL